MANLSQSAGGGFVSSSADQSGSLLPQNGMPARARTASAVPSVPALSSVPLAPRMPLAIAPALPNRCGTLLLRELIDLYMRQYPGRDTTRGHRLSWWQTRLGHLALQYLSDDHIHNELKDGKAIALSRNPNLNW